MDGWTKTLTIVWDGTHWREQTTRTVVTGIPGSWDDTGDGPSQLPPPQWKSDLSEREQVQIAHAEAYANHWNDAGVPGHGQFMLIAKLARKLNDLESRMKGPDA